MSLGIFLQIVCKVTKIFVYLQLNADFFAFFFVFLAYVHFL